MKIDDPAGDQRFVPYMNLRDWFAGMAMKGFLSSNPPIPSFINSSDADEVAERIGIAAYRMADGMLKARNQ